MHPENSHRELNALNVSQRLRKVRMSSSSTTASGLFDFDWRTIADSGPRLGNDRGVLGQRAGLDLDPSMIFESGFDRDLFCLAGFDREYPRSLLVALNTCRRKR